MSIAPMTIANIPRLSSVCGGLMIFTSRPYALCHQLSNGAEVSIANAPHVQTHAPSGPRNPRKPTLRARSSGAPASVVLRAVYPHETPTRIAERYVTMCGGDQNVSRPMVMCHE